MPYSATQDLRTKHPLDTVSKLVTTDGLFIYDGTGSQVTNLKVTSSFIPGVQFQIASPSTSSALPPNIIEVFDTTCTSPHATVKVNNKLYAGTWDGYVYVLADPDNDLTNITSSAFAYGDCSDVCYSTTTGYLYFLTDTGYIIQIDPSDVTSQTVWYDGSGLANPLSGLGGICTYGDYIYVGNHGVTTSSFVTINVNTSVLVDETNWVSESVTIGHCHAMEIDDTGTYLYAASDVGYAVKVDTSNATIQVNAPGTGLSYTDDACILGNYFYAAAESGGSIIKYNTSDMTIDSTSDALGGSYGVFSDGTHVYDLASGTNRIVIFYEGNVNYPIMFNVSPYAPNELWITDGGKFVFTSWPSSTVVKSDLSYLQIGINKPPTHTLDVNGNFYSYGSAETNATMSARWAVISSSVTFTGSRYAGSIIASSGSVTISQDFVRANRITGSVGLTGSLVGTLTGTSSWASNMSASGVQGGLTQEIYFVSESFTTMSFVNGILISVI